MEDSRRRALKCIMRGRKSPTQIYSCEIINEWFSFLGPEYLNHRISEAGRGSGASDSLGATFIPWMAEKQKKGGKNSPNFSLWKGSTRRAEAMSKNGNVGLNEGFGVQRRKNKL